MIKYMIFGAGFYGKKALDAYGEQNVDFFIDNNSEKQGTSYCGKQIISPAEAVAKCEYEIIIASIYAYSKIGRAHV